MKGSKGELDRGCQCHLILSAAMASNKTESVEIIAWPFKSCQEDLSTLE